MAHPIHQYALKWSRMITPQVRHMAFSRTTGEGVTFTEGQFITLHIDSPAKNKVLHRSYSIASGGEQTNELEIACAYVKGGIATELLFNLQPGDIIHASGPFGLFVLKKDEHPQRYIWVATGTGVTPYRSMLSELRRRFNNQSRVHVCLLQGVRTPEELLYGDEFQSFSEEFPNFTFIACYSRADGATLSRHERAGRVNSVFGELQLNPLEDIVYLCGNPNMIDDAFGTLTALGFDRKNIRREKYAFSH